jgi:hypothetical protein
MNVGIMNFGCFGFRFVGAGEIGFLKFIIKRFDTGCFGVRPAEVLKKKKF